MKKIVQNFIGLTALVSVFTACEKDLEQVTLMSASGASSFSSSTSQVVLSEATKGDEVVKFSFGPAETNININKPVYTLQFDLPSDTSGAEAWKKAIDVRLDAGLLEKAFTGEDFNSILVNQLKMTTGTPGKVVVRLKTEFTQSSGSLSTIPPLYSKLEMMVTPYEAKVVYPALLVKGGNSWVTPATRTDGFVLTSVAFNNKYEGYLYLPNSDGWGGEAFTLQSTANGKTYGWGTSATTITEGTGNLWLTPAPNYMKVNVDLDAKTISYTPVQFYVTGDHNNWNTTANPMTYNSTTKKLEANNVSLTAGKEIVFTANNGYDISYKVNSKGQIAFAGSPDWGAASGATKLIVPKTGVFKVTLDLSQGAGNYSYTIE